MANTYQLQRQEASLLNAHREDVDDGFARDGSDLYVEADIPDDIYLLTERIALDRSDIEVPLATIVANEVLLEIMNEFYNDGQDFHIHQDQELRLFVKDKMRERVIAVYGETVLTFIDDAWYNDRLATVRGFPPNRYDEPFAVEQ